MKTKLTLALVALITGSAFAAIPKVLPEFKNEKQLAEWREEMATKHAATSTSDVRSSALDVPSAFYTGKPYIESTGSYAFKYRSYNPELARWTSEDPSGFPDGANGNVYAPTPTSSVDLEGLRATGVFSSQVYSISLSVLVYDPTGTINQAKINSWISIVNTAWCYNGTDRSNQLDLSLQTSISMTLKTDGYYHEGDSLQIYDNVITFGSAGVRPTVRGGRVGFFPLAISDRLLVHEFSHFWTSFDGYTDVYTNGLLTGSSPKSGWEESIAACTQSHASKNDANLAIISTGEEVHLFE